MITLDRVSKRYNLQAGFFAPVGRYVYAVNGLSLELRDNEIYGLVGESGCGKTTTARMIIRMEEATEGNIEYREGDERHSVTELDKAGLMRYRSKVKYIFQDPARSLNPRMSVEDILIAGYRYSPHWPGRKRAREEAKAILQEVGLGPDDLERRPADFSGGQRQRISIARALIQRPRVLICDEVVSALDVSIQGQILSLLLRLREEYNLSMLFIAHDLAVVSYISDRIGVMYRGVLVEEAPAKELSSSRHHPYTQHLYSSIPQIGRAYSPMPKGTFSEKPDPTVSPLEPEEMAALTESRAGRPFMQEVATGHYVSSLFV